jgi:hypothetical protein
MVALTMVVPFQKITMVNPFQKITMVAPTMVSPFQKITMVAPTMVSQKVGKLPVASPSLLFSSFQPGKNLMKYNTFAN